jgi:hypothetical protein
VSFTLVQRLLARRRPRRKSRQPVGVHIDKLKPAKPTTTHVFRTRHAQWRLQYDDHGQLQQINRDE